MKEFIKETEINPKVEIRESSIKGKGMFALEPIGDGEIVVVWGGQYTADKDQVEKSRKEGRLVMHLDDDLYSIEERGEDLSYFMNHSCDPNVWMKDAFTLEARRDIKAGEELVADYAMWEGDDYVSKWECECGSPLCRKRITGNDWQLKELQERYSGHFSPLINKRIEKSNKNS